MQTFITVAKTSGISDLSAICVQVGAARVALFNLGGTFYAIDDACTHMGGPLSQGFVQGDDVVCPLHSARFSIPTGEATGLPAEEGVRCYNVRVVGEEIQIEVQSAADPPGKG